MSIFFHEKTRTFYLESKNITYAFRVSAQGYLRHLYYGRRIARDELGHVQPSASNARAMKLVLNGGDSKGYQHMLSEFASYGRGDFREAAYAVRTESGDRLSELIYVSHEILAEKPKPEGLPAMRTGETLVVTLKDKVTALTVKLFYTVYEDVSVIARRAEFINKGTEPLYLDRAYSFCVDFNHHEFEALSLHGAWARECMPERTPLHHGAFRVSSKQGISSAMQNPFLALVSKGATENCGEAYGFNLIYSGSFALQAEVAHIGTTRVTGGVQDFDFSWKLTADEPFATPEIVMAYSKDGIGGMSREYHDAYRKYLINPRYVYADRPVVINNWEAMKFDFDDKKLKKMIDSVVGTGIDTFVLDDGWFGARNSDKAGLGDWFVNMEKLPGGLTDIINYTHERGMKFGLWFEPEMINPDSDLFRTHPDYIIHCPDHDPALGRNQYVLDITRSDVRDYIVESVGKILREHDIDYVKWDFNRSVAENYSISLPADRQKEFHVRFALGFYDLCERLVNGFPHIFFEGCCSGGGRFDAGMLYYFPQIWTSDDTDAFMRTRIQYGASIPYPLSALSCHASASPNHQTKHATPFASRADIAHLGATGYELDPSVEPPEELAQIPAQVAAYHEIKDLILKGDLYRLSSTMDSNYFIEEVVSKDRSRAFITAMRVTSIANDEDHYMHPEGLDEDDRYYIKEMDCTLTGSTIMYAGIKLNIPMGDYITATWHLEKV